MKIISNLLKDSHDETLVRLTALINSLNPMVDRIMDDDSVEGVVMTNKAGAPILTSVSLIAANNYGGKLNMYSEIVQRLIQELDPFEKVKAIRLKTAKKEILVAPDKEFTIVVLQHGRIKEKSEHT